MKFFWKYPWLLGLTVLSMVFCIQLVFYPGYFLYDDNVTHFFPNFIFNWREVVGSGNIPLINFHQNLGMDYLSSAQSAVFYPIVYFCIGIINILGLPQYQLMDIFVLVHTFIGFVGMYYLLRKLKIDAELSVLMGLFLFSLPFVFQGMRSWTQWIYLTAGLPWVFYFIYALKEKFTWKYLWGLVFVKILWVLTGAMPWLVMVGLFEGVLLILTWKKVKKLPKLSKQLAIVWGSVVGGSLFAILPLWRAIQISGQRSERLSLENFLLFRVKLDHFIQSQFFNFQNEAVVGASGELLYIGVIPIGILVFVLLKKKFFKVGFSHQTWVASTMALIALVLSTSANQILYHLPIFSRFRWPVKYYFFFCFFATLVVALVLQALAKKIPKKNIIGLVILLIVSNIWIVYSSENQLVYADYTTRKQKPVDYSLDHKYRVITYGVDDLSKSDHLLPFNFATLYQQYSFGGYNPLISKPAYELTLKNWHANTYFQPLDDRFLNHLRLSGVKYLITTNNSVLESESLTQIDSAKDLKIYELEGSWPVIAAVNGDEFEPIDFEYQSNKLKILDNVAGKNLLVRVNPLPGWYYQFDNQPKLELEAEIYPFNIKVPDGVEEVVIGYRHKPFEKGLLLSGIFWCGVVFVATQKQLGFIVKLIEKTIK